MEKVALWVMLKSKAGKEDELADVSQKRVPLVEAEPDTIGWYALQIGPSTFGIFDTFAGDCGPRRASLRESGGGLDGESA